jgi:hypothetical protein
MPDNAKQRFRTGVDMNCGTCDHWDLKHSPLKAHGFGNCKTLSNGGDRSHTFPAVNRCRFGKWKAAEAATIAARVKAGA